MIMANEKKIQFSQHKWWRKKTIITTQERVLTSYKIQSNTHGCCCYRPCETVTFVTFMHAFSLSSIISNKNRPKKSKSYQYQTAAAANKTKANRKRIPWFQCRWTSCNNLFNFNIYYNNRNLLQKRPQPQQHSQLIRYSHSSIQFKIPTTTTMYMNSIRYIKT